MKNIHIQSNKLLGGSMLSKEQLVDVTKKFPNIKLKLIYKEWQTDFFRFYKSQSNYNITKATTYISIVMEKDKRLYTFSLQEPTNEKLIRAIEENISTLDFLPQDTDFTDFDNDTNEIKTQKKKNANITLEKKIEILETIARKTQKFDFDIYGTFITNHQKFCIVNSNGVAKDFEVPAVMLDMKAVSNKNMVTIVEKYGSSDFNSFDLDNFTNNLIEKIKSAQQDIVDVIPGVYTTILSPYATVQFLQYFLYNAMGRTLYSKQSFLEGKLNKKIFPDLISLYDNPYSERLISYPYNEDGRLLNKLPIIENGVLKNFLIDKYFSSILDMPITGNQLSNIEMLSGNNSLQEMIESVENGLYISNIHYMNFINFKETSVTGLTRDGTFLIKNGKLSKVVNNLRFTLKISELFENVTMVENKNYPVPYSTNYNYFEIYSSLVPHIKTEKFHITSSTKTI